MTLRFPSNGRHKYRNYIKTVIRKTDLQCITTHWTCAPCPSQSKGEQCLWWDARECGALRLIRHPLVIAASANNRYRWFVPGFNNWHVPPIVCRAHTPTWPLAGQITSIIRLMMQIANPFHHEDNIHICLLSRWLSLSTIASRRSNDVAINNII